MARPTRPVGSSRSPNRRQSPYILPRLAGQVLKQLHKKDKLAVSFPTGVALLRCKGEGSWSQEAADSSTNEVALEANEACQVPEQGPDQRQSLYYAQ